MSDEGTIPYDGDLSIKQVIEHLEFLKKREKSSVLKDTMTFAIQLIGRCLECVGTGEEWSATKPDNNYQVKTTPKGSKYFVTACKACKGIGKQLDVLCRSCGESAALRPAQRQLNYCHQCETRLRKSGDLI